MGGGAPNDAPPASTQPRLIPRAGAATRPPNHWKRPTASTTDFMPVTGRAATRLMRASLAMATMAPLQNSFAVLDSANNVGTAIIDGNEDDKATDNIMTANDSDVEQMEGTSREDGNSQPLLDTVKDSITGTIETMDRILASTLADIAADDTALDSAIRGVTATLDRDDDDDTVVPPPTMQSMMAMLQTMQSNILTRLDMMESSLGGASKAEALEIAHLDQHLESLATTLRNDVQPQLDSNSSTITDIKANLKHLTQLQNTSDTTTTTRIDALIEIEAHNTRFDSLTATCDTGFAAINARIRGNSPWACNDLSSVPTGLSGLDEGR